MEPRRRHGFNLQKLGSFENQWMNRMAGVTYFWRQALDCARRANEATDEEERCLLFEMSQAWKNLAVAEADVTKQAAAEWTPHTLH
jgi:hypothetical protein